MTATDAHAPTIAEILRRLLSAKGMTPRTLDEVAGLGQDGTRNILRGRSSAPRAATLQAIANALSVPVGVFFGEAAAPAPTGDLPPIRRRPGVMMQPRQPEPGDELAPTLPDRAPTGLCDVESYDLRPRADPIPAIRHSSRRGPGTLRLPELPLALAGASAETVVAVRAPGEGFAPDIQPGSWILVDTDQTVPSRGIYVVWDGVGHQLARLVQQPTGEGPKLLAQLADGSEPESLKGYKVIGRLVMRFAVI